LAKYEVFYIRPTNGRADDQLRVRRNHSTLHFSFPDYEWYRLRKEGPGQYESYVDLVPGEWTEIKVEASGVKARLYVNGFPHPVLVVNGLKLGDSKIWGVIYQYRYRERGVGCPTRFAPAFFILSIRLCVGASASRYYQRDVIVLFTAKLPEFLNHRRDNGIRALVAVFA
jgi:hypothetical protein